MLQADYASVSNAATILPLGEHSVCIQAVKQQSMTVTLNGRLKSAYDQREQQQVCLSVGCSHSLQAKCHACNPVVYKTGAE